MTAREYLHLVRLSGILWHNYGGEPNRWDSLAGTLLECSPKTKKYAMEFYFGLGLSLDLADRVWRFLLEVRKNADPRSSSNKVQSLLEFLEGCENQSREEGARERDGLAPEQDCSGTGP